MFLRSNLLTSTQPTVVLSATPVKAIRFVPFASAAHSVGPNGDIYDQIQIEAYLACTDSKVQLWYQRSDQTAPVGPFDLQNLDPQNDYFLDATSVVRAVLEGAKT